MIVTLNFTLRLPDRSLKIYVVEWFKSYLMKKYVVDLFPYPKLADWLKSYLIVTLMITLQAG